MDKHDIIIITAGSADAGKSTTIGVLTKLASICNTNGANKKNEDNNYLDNGNGKMRDTVCNFRHEIESGKTSSIATRNLVCKENKIILVDLCGQSKYLKTTLYGITGSFPDYGMLVIAANRGLVDMAEEHLNIMLAYGLTFVILITRVDLIKDFTDYNKIIHRLTTMLTRYKRKVILVNKYDEEKAYIESDVVANEMRDVTTTIPIISISNTTGYYINYVKTLFDNLKPKDNGWSNADESIFYMDATYKVKGIGYVVSGILRGKSVKTGDILSIGPIGKQFMPVKISSIHDNDRNKVDELYNRQRGCFAIKPVGLKWTFSSLRKGTVLISPNVCNSVRNVCYIFKCDIQIMSKPSMSSVNMCNGYCPVIHCNGIRQSAKLLLDEVEVYPETNEPVISLKAGPLYKNIKLQFLYNPAFIEVGARFFFREDSTKGRGFIREIYPV